MGKIKKILFDKLYLHIIRLFFIVLIPTIILAVFAFFHTQQTALQTAEQTINKQLSHAVQEIDSKLMNIVTLRQVLSSDTELISLELSEPSDAANTVKMINTRHFLSNSILLNDFLHEIILYTGEDKVVSSSGIYPTDYYFTKYKLFEGYSMDDWNRLLAKRGDIVYLQPTTLLAQTINRYTKHTVLPVSNNITLQGGKGLLLFVLDTEKMTKTLSDYIPYDEAYFTIVDIKGDILANTPNALPEEQLVSFTYQSSQNSWQYTVSIPRKAITLTSEQMLKQVFLMVLAVLFLSVVLTLQAGRRMYQPLSSIRTMLNEETQMNQATSHNSLDNLELQVSTLVKNKSNAKLELNALARTYAESMLLSQTMTDNKTTQLEAIMTRFLGFHKGPYQCIAVKFAKGNTSVENIAQKTFARYFPVYSIGYSENIALFLIETGSIYNRAIIITATGELSQKLPGEIRGIAAGCEILTVKDLPKSINTSLTVLQRAEDEGKSILLFADDFDIAAQYMYSHKDEWILVESLQRNEKDRLHHQLDNILLKNYEKLVSYQQIQNLFEQLRNTAYRYAQQANILLPPRSYDKTSSFDTLREELHTLYDILLVDTNDKTQSTHVHLAQSADAYIHQHYAQDIYLDTIAKALGVSAKHLSKVYKQQRNINITDQLAFVRITQAKTLLKTTELNINTIMRQTGFISRATFLRSFKKYTDISPSVYRQLHQTTAEDEFEEDDFK